MKSRFLFPVFVLGLLAACARLTTDRLDIGGLGACPSLTAGKLLEQQSQYGSQSDTPALQCALAYFRASRDPSLRRTALGAKLCLNLAEREPDADRRDKLASEGVSMAEAALAAGGEGDGVVHYYLAANLGLAVRDHLTLAMDNMKRLEVAMQKAVALSPGIDDGGPLRLLGTLYTRAPAWPDGIGDRDKGLDLLAQAVKQFPQHPLNHLFYAESILAVDDEGAAERAKAEFNLGEKLLQQGDWEYSKPSWQREFDDLRSELGS